MKKRVSFKLNKENKISVFNQNKEILKIDGAAVHTIQKPEIIFHKFEQNGDSFGCSLDDISIEAEIHEEGGILAFLFGGKILSRENSMGYPNALSAHNSLEISLALDEDTPFMATYQHKAWWLRPAFGKKYAEIPEKTQLLILKKEQQYEVYLAVCGEESRTDICGKSNGIRISVSSNIENQKIIKDIAMIWGCGENPYEVIEKCIVLAKKMKNNKFTMSKEKNYPSIFENIGWCTWDSLGQNVSETAIFDKMDEFQEKGIVIPWVLIDDGWSYVNREKLTLKDLDADPERFPNGIAGTVKVLKEKYHVSYVGVWQAFKGYWYGLEENSEADHILSAYTTKYGNGEITVKPTVKDAFGFWNRWHSELKQKGIDFVKIDGQSSFSSVLNGSSTYGSALNALYTGLEASVFLNFGGNLINCMGMAPENVWNRHYSAISRTSDDYTPTVDGSFAEHALQNCYNSVYQGDLYVGDWDMFWSSHEEAEESAILRIISGGPVYISDACGCTKKEELDKIVRFDGNLLRCSGVARPTLDCLTEDVLHKGKILKIYNECNKSIMVACFALKNQTESNLRLSDIPCKKYEKYWIYDWHTRKVDKCDAVTEYNILMNGDRVKLLELIPEENGIAVLGIVDKYIPSAGVSAVHGFENICFVEVNCSGQLGFITEKEVLDICINGKKIAFDKKESLYLVNIDHEQAYVEIRYKM